MHTSGGRFLKTDRMPVEECASELKRVAWLKKILWSHSESKFNKLKSLFLDPKPSDLPMIRVKCW